MKTINNIVLSYRGKSREFVTWISNYLDKLKHLSSLFIYTKKKEKERRKVRKISKNVGDKLQMIDIPILLWITYLDIPTI